MDFTVVQLETAVIDSGQDAPPSTDIRAMIDSIGNRTPFAGMRPVGN